MGLLLAIYLFIIVNLKGSYHDFDLAKQYTQDTFTDTGSKSPVTGIYLDYRLYDSLFESLLLIVSVIGIRYLNKRDV